MKSVHVLILVIALAPTALPAQMHKSVIVVGVADEITGAPLAEARVRVTDLDRVAMTDWIGEARLVDVTRGPHRIEAQQLGYQPANVTMLVNGDSVGVVFRLLRVSSTLDTVRITGARVPAYLEEFERRRRVGLGRFLTSSQLDSLRSELVADVAARRFPGLLVRWSSDHTAVQILSSHTTTSLDHLCVPQVYIDGFFRNSDDLVTLQAADVAGIEYYTLAPPPQYVTNNKSGWGCGTLVIWTKQWE
jgi:hypothetical protein